VYLSQFGWGWLLEDYGFEPHMVHPLQCKAIASARLKSDKVDAATLAQLLCADLLPKAASARLRLFEELAKGHLRLDETPNVRRR
jgi:transposase